MTMKKPRAKSGAVLAKMREICLALPDTALTLPWGEPHFRVAGKIFAGYGEKDGKVEIGFKLEKEHAARLVHTDPRFRPAPYVGKHGWVSMDAARIRDWSEVKALIHESYELIAPKKVRAKPPRAGARASNSKRPSRTARRKR